MKKKTSILKGLNIGSALAALALATSAPALAQDAEGQAPTQATAPAETVEATESSMPGTQKGCVDAYKSDENFDITTCITRITERARAELAEAEAEIAARQDRVENKRTEIAARTERTEDKEGENADKREELDQIIAKNAVLRKENEQLAERVEGLRQLRDITREEIERDPSSN